MTILNGILRESGSSENFVLTVICAPLVWIIAGTFSNYSYHLFFCGGATAENITDEAAAAIAREDVPVLALVI